MEEHITGTKRWLSIPGTVAL